MDDQHTAHVYAIRARGARSELLALRDAQEQVRLPCAIISPDEEAAEAAFRALSEQTGLAREHVGRVRMVRADRWRESPEAPWMLRYFIAMEIEREPRHRWQHIVQTERQGSLVECHWMALPLKKPDIQREQHAWVHLLS